MQDISLNLQGGNGLGIIGPSGSGKSSLARMLVGVWQPLRGRIRLDGAAFDQWSPEALGAHIGYLPQDVELLAGTVAQNIARFAPQPDPDAIIAAANAADVHDLIVGLPTATTPRSARAALPCRPGRRSASRWRARFTAIRSWSCSTSRTPISTPKATRR